MTPSIDSLDAQNAEKSPIQTETAARTRHRAAPTTQVSGTKTLTLSSDINAVSGLENSIFRPSGGASLDITGKHSKSHSPRPNVDCTDFPGCTDSAHFPAQRQRKGPERLTFAAKTSTPRRWMWWRSTELSASIILQINWTPNQPNHPCSARRLSDWLSGDSCRDSIQIDHRSIPDDLHRRVDWKRSPADLRQPAK